MPELEQLLHSDWLGAFQLGKDNNGVGIDQTDGPTGNRLRGYVVAEEGPFKSKGRGEFDENSLRSIVVLMNKAGDGLPVRFQHPNMCDDKLESFLGRLTSPRMDSVLTKQNGKSALRRAVRADLNLDPTAMGYTYNAEQNKWVPSGDTRKPLGRVVMDLVRSDRGAISSSLQIVADQEYRLDGHKRNMKGPDGVELPPIWRPKELMGSDIVAVGDAVGSLLSPLESLDVDRLSAAALKFLDRVFSNHDRDFIEQKIAEWKDAYLSQRFADEPGDEEDEDATPVIHTETTIELGRSSRVVEMETILAENG